MFRSRKVANNHTSHSALALRYERTVQLNGVTWNAYRDVSAFVLVRISTVNDNELVYYV